MADTTLSLSIYALGLIDTQLQGKDFSTTGVNGGALSALVAALNADASTANTTTDAQLSVMSGIISTLRTEPPAPEAPAPEPEAPAPAPEATAPAPEAPAPAPEAPAPAPEAPASEPEAPASEPEAPASEPEAPASEPEAPAPAHVDPVALGDELIQVDTLTAEEEALASQLQADLTKHG